jgi:hypothetical protein
MVTLPLPCGSCQATYVQVPTTDEEAAGKTPRLQKLSDTLTTTQNTLTTTPCMQTHPHGAKLPSSKHATTHSSDLLDGPLAADLDWLHTRVATHHTPTGHWAGWQHTPGVRNSDSSLSAGLCGSTQGKTTQSCTQAAPDSYRRMPGGIQQEHMPSQPRYQHRHCKSPSSILVFWQQHAGSHTSP